jgi:hypothetical protein
MTESFFQDLFTLYGYFLPGEFLRRKREEFFSIGEICYDTFSGDFFPGRLI